ncbi:WXG100-like domain-containing protein [Actinoallomurus soli]|uniref:WXG100-like domain-containing protein n=1 Tax=Actinoallomurus soli TaxID=2952535 RepID=UPI002091F56F|nr:hypothetical protein [Actinoallomurus soli]MCO5973142.1 hypothetical protein [Actinoallomurus soli]
MDITPETVDRAAANFATGQQDLIRTYTTLSQKLAAHSAGMAGFDKAAHQLAAFYDPAAKAAFQAFHTAIEALGGTSLGLTQTINNHLAADHHSRADNPGDPPPQYPVHPVTQNFAVAAAPPSVIGAMSWAPHTTVPLIRVRLPHLPGWVDDLIGTSDDWPQGNPQMFDQTGDAWSEAAKEIGQIASWLDWTITTILDPADNAEHSAVADYWATLYRPADSTTVLSGLSTMCQALAHACHEYAQAIRDATKIVTGEHIAEIIILLSAEAAAGLLRRALGPLLRRAGAFMLRSVTGIATRWAIRETLADLLKAIADTKIVTVVKAGFDKTVGRALGKELDRAQTFADSELAKTADTPAKRGIAYEKYLREKLGGEESFKAANRQFDGKYVGTQGQTWFEAKSGEYWKRILENQKDYNKFLSQTGNQLQITQHEGVGFEIISENPIPEKVMNWLNKKGIPYRVIP